MRIANLKGDIPAFATNIGIQPVLMQNENFRLNFNAVTVDYEHN